jgi:hypothetical protein
MLPGGNSPQATNVTTKYMMLTFVMQSTLHRSIHGLRVNIIFHNMDSTKPLLSPEIWLTDDIIDASQKTLAINTLMLVLSVCECVKDVMSHA